MKVLVLFGVAFVLSLGMVLANPDPLCAAQQPGPNCGGGTPTTEAAGTRELHGRGVGNTM